MTHYRESMRQALERMYEINERKRSESIVEASMKPAQIAALKKAYEPMRGKRISADNAIKLQGLMDKFDKDKNLLIQLFKADIPFVSILASTRLISKHGMKGAELNKIQKEEMEFWEELELDEAKETWVVYNRDNGKAEKYFSNKIPADRHRDKLNKKYEASGNLPYAVMQTEEVELDEKKGRSPSARADAMKAMRRSGEFKDKDDDDIRATDADVKAASKNILMQMKSAADLPKGGEIEFLDKKKVKVPQKVAQLFVRKYMSLRRPADKAKFQEKAAKSYKDFVSAMKEGVESEHTILDRIHNKIQERKNV